MRKAIGPLRFDVASALPRRIDQEYRLVYEIEKDELRVISRGCHY